MSILSVIDNQYAQLVFYSDVKIIHHTFRKSLDSAHFRLVLNSGVDLLKRHNATKWLSDNREIGPHAEGDDAWANSDWLPRAVAAGWKYWALVVPHDVKARMSMSDVIASFYDVGIRVMVFTEVEEAKNWLIQVDRA
jgi:hypothetical protein